MEADKAAQQSQAGAAPPGTAQAGTTHVGGGPQPGGSAATVQAPAPSPRRFHGAVSLEPTRLSRDAGKIAEEVVQHLAGLVGATVEVNLEIQAEVPGGVPDNVVRIVTENCRTLRFKTQGFEEK